MRFSPLRLEVSALAATPEPLSLDLVKQHCAIEAGETEFDAQLALYARAAILWAEGETRRAIHAREHVWTISGFPRGREQRIWLPRGKTQSVASIAYVTSAGTVETLTGPSSDPAGAGFREELGGDDGAVLTPLHGGCWPTADCAAPAPVKITFTAGWDAAAVPEDLTHALLFAVSDMFELRGNADWKEAGGNFAFCEMLVSAYRLARVY